MRMPHEQETEQKWIVSDSAVTRGAGEGPALLVSQSPILP